MCRFYQPQLSSCRAGKHSGALTVSGTHGKGTVRPLLRAGNCCHTKITWIILVAPTASGLTRRGSRMARAVLSWTRERPTRLRGGQNTAHVRLKYIGCIVAPSVPAITVCARARARVCVGGRVRLHRAARTPDNPTESAATRASPLYSTCRVSETEGEHRLVPTRLLCVSRRLYSV